MVVKHLTVNHCFIQCVNEMLHLNSVYNIMMGVALHLATFKCVEMQLDAGIPISTSVLPM